MSLQHSLFVLWIPTVVLAAETEEVQFSRDIRPILSDKCYECHGPDANHIKGKLQLHKAELATAALGKKKDRHAIVPGDRKASELWWRITDPDDPMPPEDSLHRLTKAEISLLGRWLDQGAKYEGHWSFQPIVAPKGQSIDSLVRKSVTEAELLPSPQADRNTLLRRLSLDLTGLPPSPEELGAFVADGSPRAYERQVDRLLASPAAAERLATDWLDGARYADTNGYSIDDHRDMWIWRDWVLHAFQSNKPFDEFAVEQIAGDLIPGATEQQRVASGFLRNGMNTHEGGIIPEEYRVTYTVDKVDTVATVFMGLTMKCAQCHDHKFDPIAQKEYYQFFSFFNSSSEPGTGATNANTAPLIEAQSAVCSVERVKRDAALRIEELEDLRARPEGEFLELRESWEQQILPTLTPPDAVAKGDAFPLFPKEAPYWIWLAEDPQAAQVHFRRSFNLAAVPKEARLWVSCDNSCSIRINGVEVGSMDDWTQPKVFLAKGLKRGENIIEVEAANIGGSPGGLLLSLAMKAEDGELGYVTTDGSWKARLPSAGVQLPATPAKELAKHGNGLWGTLYGKPGSSEGKGHLYTALAKTAAERTVEDWKAINDAFVKTSAEFRIYLKQIDVEQRILQKTAQSGRATVMVMNYKPRKTHILNRGAYNDPGDEVFAGTPSFLPALPEGGSGDKPVTRLDLARWLVKPEHPLTSRVIVNRYWQMIFGSGLVRTAEDFGLQGEYPSHPELLDLLAADFVESGWDVRRLLKRLVMSETYRQTSVVTAEMLEKDPTNRLMARAPRYRLAAEFVRDNALAASGLLSRELGGPSVHPPQPKDLWAEVSHYGYSSPFTSQKYLPGRTKRANYRRSMYTVWKRTSPPPSMAIFDAPTRETCVARRLVTNTPLQALVLQNDPQFLEAARHLGKLMADCGSLDVGIDLGFLRVLGRTPRKEEAKLLKGALARYAEKFRQRPEDARAFIGAESDGNTVEQMAWSLVASTLLNMDEAITRQ